RRPCRAPGDYRGRTGTIAEPGSATRRGHTSGGSAVAGNRRADVAGRGGLLLLRMDAVDVPELAAFLFSSPTQASAGAVSALFVGGVFSGGWGRLSGRGVERRDLATIW